MEFTWLKKINFYPDRPGDLSQFKRICIGTKSRNLGDALVLTTLPQKLKKKYPHLKIYTYPRGFNPTVFKGNPDIDGISYLPSALYGDDANWGKGHLFQQKEQFFDLSVSPEPKAEIYLTATEKESANQWIQNIRSSTNKQKPICLLHSAGATHHSLASSPFWKEIVSKWKEHFLFCQVGIQGQKKIEGCDTYLLPPKGRRPIRQVFAIFSQCQFFIGVDSGPMHIARAFSLPSLVLTNTNAARAFLNRKEFPYFLHQNYQHSFLYEENTHISYSDLTSDQILDQVSNFLKVQKSGID